MQTRSTERIGTEGCPERKASSTVFAWFLWLAAAGCVFFGHDWSNELGVAGVAFSCATKKRRMSRLMILPRPKEPTYQTKLCPISLFCDAISKIRWCCSNGVAVLKEPREEDPPITRRLRFRVGAGAIPRLVEVVSCPQVPKIHEMARKSRPVSECVCLVGSPELLSYAGSHLGHGFLAEGSVGQ